MRKPSNGAGRELHKRATQGRNGHRARHGIVIIVQVLDLQEISGAEILSNLGQRTPGRGFGLAAGGFPTMLSTEAVDCRKVQAPRASGQTCKAMISRK
jgi:hypothetical protein